MAKQDANKKFNKNSSNRRTKGRSRKPFNEKKEYEGENANDIAWHKPTDGLLKDAASIQWSWSTGRPMHLRTPAGTAFERDFILPGIQVIRTAITPGVGHERNDAINVTSQALYTAIRRQLKSANNYEASDVIIYMLGVTEIIACISWIRRLYDTTMLYSFENAMLPDALIYAQGVNPSELHAHATEFRSRANQLIAKASQIWFPKGFSFIERAKWLYSGYYSEGSSIKDQIYMYAPGFFRKFATLSGSDYAGGMYPFMFIPTYEDTQGDEPLASLMTPDEILNGLEIMINSLVGDSDFQNIAGDLFNCYGEGGVETFTLIPDDGITYPVMSEEVLEQMQNARCLNYIASAWQLYGEAEKLIIDDGMIADFFSDNSNLNIFTVRQNEAENVLNIQNFFSWGRPLSDKNDFENLVTAETLDPVLTVHSNPSDEKTMLITRLTNAVTDVYWAEDSTIRATYVFDAAEELVLGFETFYNTADGQLHEMFWTTAHDPFQYGSTDRLISLILKREPFHYAPMMNYLGGAGTVQIGGNLDIMAPISARQLKDLNRVDLMKLLAVPNVGKVNG